MHGSPGSGHTIWCPDPAPETTGYKEELQQTSGKKQGINQAMKVRIFEKTETKHKTCLEEGGVTPLAVSCYCKQVSLRLRGQPMALQRSNDRGDKGVLIQRGSAQRFNTYKLLPK